MHEKDALCTIEVQVVFTRLDWLDAEACSRTSNVQVSVLD